MQVSYNQLTEVFEYFMGKVLEPISTQNIEKLSPKINNEMAEHYSNALNATIKNNCSAEFYDICDERKVQQKLDELDKLKASDGLQVDMRAFAFTPQDPEYIKEKVIFSAKMELIQKLQTTLNSLDKKIEMLTPREEAASQKVEEYNARVENLLEKIEAVKNGERI